MDIPGRQIWATESHQIAPQHSALSSAVSISTTGGVYDHHGFLCAFLSEASPLRGSSSREQQELAVFVPSFLWTDEPCTEHFPCATSQPLEDESGGANIAIFALHSTSTKCEQLRPFFEVTHLQSGLVASFLNVFIFLVSSACFFWLALPTASRSIQQTLPRQMERPQFSGALEVSWQPPGLEVLSCRGKRSLLPPSGKL